MVLFPWEEVKKVVIFDDFLVYAENLDARILDPRSIIERYNITSIIEYFTFEVLWDFILVSLMNLTDNNSELSLRLISFLSIYIFELRLVDLSVFLLFGIGLAIIGLIKK